MILGVLGRVVNFKITKFSVKISVSCDYEVVDQNVLGQSNLQDSLIINISESNG